MERASDPQPRSRVVTISPAEVQVALHRASLGDDPFDPRMGQILAVKAFWDWAAMEGEGEDWQRVDDAQVAAKQDKTDAESVWETAPEVLQRMSPVVDVVYEGHRIGLLPLVRREGARGPAEYALPTGDLVPLPLRLEALCCVYIQFAQSGEATVLLDGFVGGTELKESLWADAGNKKAIVIPEEQLRPMHELYGLLMRRSGGAPLDLSQGPHRVTWSTASMSMLVLGVCVVTAAVTWWLWPSGVRPPPTVALARSVAEWQLNTEAVRGIQGIMPIVQSGQKYTLTVHVATPRPYGWLWQIDVRGAVLLGTLSAQGPGILGRTYTDEFDDLAGLEFFVVVLADAEVPEFAAAKQPAGWLSPVQAQKLQELGRQQDDEVAVALVRQALGWLEGRGTPYDVRIFRVNHLPR